MSLWSKTRRSSSGRASAFTEHDYRVNIGDGKAAWQILQIDMDFDGILLDRGLQKLDEC
jgi:hypothetical protein